MAQQPEVFNVQEKLDILSRAKSYFCHHLIPSVIVPNMNMVIGNELRARILEKEDAGCREEAVTLLIDKVIEEGERGLNIFMDVLQGEGISADWPQYLHHLENSSGSVGNEHVNECCGLLINLLEGQIIKKLTKDQLTAVFLELHSLEVLMDYEKELLENRLEIKGRHSAAVQMFTLMQCRTDQWPEKFFSALKKECPDLLMKIVPYEPDPIVDKESSVASSSLHSSEQQPAMPQDTGEETQLKQFASQTSQGASCPIPANRPVLPPAADEGGQGQAGFSSEEKQDTDERGEGQADFSDEEKQDTEESEKTQPGAEPRSQAPVELDLRDYQLELAEQALQGHNSIICAPTGSGKTRVALHIVQRHLEAAHPGQQRKVVFLARTVPLVSQQYKNFKKYLPNYECELVTGESENSMNMHHQLEKNDILVLTPKILENHLTPEKIPSLSAFSLLIFDECHHTRKGEPYNSVMKHYLKSKSEGEQALPQIVGLTASIGVERATTPSEAKDSILNIMSNLDVTTISRVRHNEDELRVTVPRPEEELMRLRSREDDDINSSISNIMLKMLEELGIREKAVATDKEVDEIRRLLNKRETDLRSQRFGQWAISLRNQARLHLYPATPKDGKEQAQMIKRQAFSGEVQVLAEWLVIYNEAFDVHDLTCPEDVLDYLERKSALQREVSKQYLSTELEDKVLGYFNDVRKKLQKLSRQQNPNLQMLGNVILRHVEDAGNESDGFRILVFVRTRATCRALCRWLNSSDAHEKLRALKAQPFTGTGAHQEHGGMTPYEQVETLQRFKMGDVRLLVSTSVGEEGIDIAECNLTVRYNHVGNEVTTVQTRGRSRKRGGRSLLMAMPKIIEQEEMNRKREQLMHSALLLIDAMRPGDIHTLIQKLQTRSLQVEEIDQIMKQVKKLKKEADFSITCPKCYEVKVNGAQIRTINNAHRVIIGHDIDDKIVIRPGKTILEMDDWKMHGAVVCKCRQPLGQLLTYKKAMFILVSPKNWLFLDKDNKPCSYKKWNGVPYQIQEVSADDIKEHLHLHTASDEESDGPGVDQP